MIRWEVQRLNLSLGARFKSLNLNKNKPKMDKVLKQKSYQKKKNPQRDRHRKEFFFFEKDSRSTEFDEWDIMNKRLLQRGENDHQSEKTQKRKMVCQSYVIQDCHLDHRKKYKI